MEPIIQTAVWMVVPDPSAAQTVLRIKIVARTVDLGQIAAQMVGTDSSVAQMEPATRIAVTMAAKVRFKKLIVSAC